MSFTKGQIIYVMSDKTQTVLPGIIKKVVHTDSMEGEELNYVVGIGPPNKQRVVDLSTVDGVVYGDLSEIREVLIARLTSFVDELCTTTSGRVAAWYGVTGNPGTLNVPPGEKIDPSVLMQELNFVQPQPAPRQNLTNLQTSMVDPDLLTREYVAEDGTIRKVPV